MLSIVRLLSLVELYSNRLIYEQEYVRVRCLNRFHHLFCVAFSIFIVESKEKKQQQPKHTLLYISSPTLLIGSFVERIISSISLRSFSFLFIIEHSSFDYINSIEHFHFLFFLSLATFVFFFFSFQIMPFVSFFDRSLPKTSSFRQSNHLPSEQVNFREYLCINMLPFDC